MEIIAHRGTWNTIEQQNTLQSFYKSFKYSFEEYLTKELKEKITIFSV